MTHNLPDKIRDHFTEQNLRHLTRRSFEELQYGIKELCPVYIHIKKEGVVVYDLTAYGYTSNSCMDCPGIDNTCEVFLDYLKSSLK